MPRVSPHPGIHLSCLEWFREKDIAAIAWDMMDERPSGYPGFAMSTHLAIPFLGLVLVDNTNPERLAKACAEEGRYEFLFTATPIRLVGATGAPRTRSRSSERRDARRQAGRAARPAQQHARHAAGRVAVLQRHLAVDHDGGDALRLLHQPAGAAGQVGLHRRQRGPHAASSNSTRSAL